MTGDERGLDIGYILFASNASLDSVKIRQDEVAHNFEILAAHLGRFECRVMCQRMQSTDAVLPPPKSSHNLLGRDLTNSESADRE